MEELRKILTERRQWRSPTTSRSHAQSAAAAEFLRMEADWESAYQLTLRAAWQADNNIPNSKEASMAKAKAGRVGSDITLKAVELAGTTGYSEQTLLEKWARDSKIMDIFEGTQQIQQLVVARRLLGCRPPNSSSDPSVPRHRVQPCPGGVVEFDVGDGEVLFEVPHRRGARDE